MYNIRVQDDVQRLDNTNRMDCHRTWSTDGGEAPKMQHPRAENGTLLQLIKQGLTTWTGLTRMRRGQNRNRIYIYSKTTNDVNDDYNDDRDYRSAPTRPSV